MNHFYKTKHYYLLFLFLSLISMTGSSQNIVSYAYDNAGNRISRQVVVYTTTLKHAKENTEDPAPVEEQLGERKIMVYPNPTKGALAVEITGGNDKPVLAGGDEIRILLFSAQGIQLQNMKAETGKNPINMLSYPTGWYVLRIQAGDEVTEFKIVKQ